MKAAQAAAQTPSSSPPVEPAGGWEEVRRVGLPTAGQSDEASLLRAEPRPGPPWGHRTRLAVAFEHCYRCRGRSHNQPSDAIKLGAACIARPEWQRREAGRALSRATLRDDGGSGVVCPAAAVPAAPTAAAGEAGVAAPPELIVPHTPQPRLDHGRRRSAGPPASPRSG